ncbi:MAG: SIMPL domain-containing protein [Phycisphaerales bacterium]|nr:SIMPL domain-containing protein [Phycisphaerales bacterium]
MEQTIRIRALGAAVVVALGVAASVVTSAVVASKAYRGRADQSARQQQEMTVKGSARVRVRSDLAVWQIAVRGEGADLKTAYGVLKFATDRVQSFLKSQRFADPEIGLSAIDTETHHARDKEGRETRDIAGYSLDRTFTVTTTDVDRISHAAGEVTQLLQENVQVRSYAPAYSYTKVADIKVQILGEASKDALVRAGEIARNAGCQVGEVRRAQMGVVQITQPNSTEVRDYGMYDTSTIDKDVSVVVTVTFAVEN